MIELLWQLFSIFFVIGMFTFGGGYAVVSLIQTQVVTNHGWLSQGTFADILAISQMTPGPIGVNCATYVGYEVVREAGASHFMGILGSFIATSAVVLPSFMIVLALVKFYSHFHDSPVFKSVMQALRPAVVGMIASAAIVLMFNIDWEGMNLHMSLIRDTFPDWKSWCLFGAAMFVSFKWKVGPIPLIVAGGVLGLLLY